MSGKTILLTWWTWFIWSHLLKALIDFGHRVILLKRDKSNIEKIAKILTEKYEYITVFNINEQNIEDIFRNNSIDIIIHLAAYYKKNHTPQDINEMIYSNINYPTLLCELSIKYWVKYFINTWTFFEYEHKKNEKNILDEKSTEKSYNLYAATKLAFNEIFKLYTQNNDFKGVNLRLFSPYWPKDNEKIIPILIKAILQKKELKLSWWKQELTFTYIEDITDAYMRTIEFIEKMDTSYEVFNIWYDNTSSISNIIDIIKYISWENIDNIKLWEIPYWDNEIFDSTCNNNKAKEILNRIPKYSIEKWLTLTYKYYKNEIQ